MEWLCFWFFLAMAATPVVKAINEAIKRKEMNEHLKQNPEVFIQLRRMEHEQAIQQQQLEQQQKQIKHDQLKTATGIGMMIARWWLGK